MIKPLSWYAKQGEIAAKYYNEDQDDLSDEVVRQTGEVRAAEPDPDYREKASRAYDVGWEWGRRGHS